MIWYACAAFFPCILYIEVAININVTEVPIHLFLVTTLKSTIKIQGKKILNKRNR
jgi:hypothetical protein